MRGPRTHCYMYRGFGAGFSALVIKAAALE